MSVKKSKVAYFNARITKSHNKSKEMWQVVNTLTSANTKDARPVGFSSDSFNDFFVDHIENTCDNNPSINFHSSFYVSKCISNDNVQFSFKHVNDECMYRNILKLIIVQQPFRYGWICIWIELIKLSYTGCFFKLATIGISKTLNLSTNFQCFPSSPRGTFPLILRF